MTFAEKWMQLENTVLSKISQVLKDKYHRLYMWNLKSNYLCVPVCVSLCAKDDRDRCFEKGFECFSNAHFLCNLKIPTLGCLLQRNGGIMSYNQNAHDQQKL